jgi:hypothetical protein
MLRMVRSLLNRSWAWEGVVSFVLPLVLYGRTTAPTVFGLDSAELTTGAVTLGLVHAPGYPLYLLLGHFFTMLPLGGDAGYRLNIMSALFGALTNLFLYLSLVRLTRSRFPALVSALMFGFSPYFWNEAVVAEVYTLNTCLIAAALLLLLLGRDKHDARWLGLAVWLYGLSLGNHLSVLLLGPGLIVWLLAFGGRRMAWRWWVTCGALFSLGLCVYAYLPLRFMADPPLNYAASYFHVDLTTWDGLWWMLSAQMFRPLAFAFSPAQLPGELLRFVRWMLESFLVLGLLLGAMGICWDARRQPALHLGLGLMFLIPSIFYINYSALDKVTMFLPVYLIWAIWIGLGVEALWGRIADLRLQPAERVGLARQLKVVLVILLIGFAWLNYDRVDMSRTRDARDHGHKIFSRLPRDSVFFGSWADIPILEYLQIVEGERPDVALRNVVLMAPQQALGEAMTASFQGKAYAGGIYDSLAAGGFRAVYVRGCSCYRLVAPRTLYP